MLDEGAGVPLVARERIFEKYARVEPDEVHDATGRGLGLTFCRLAVEGHGGTIAVEDNRPRGSVFTVRLPRAAAAAAAARA